MSYQVDIVVDVPGLSWVDVLDRNFEGKAPTASGADLSAIALRLAPLLGADAEVRSDVVSLWAFEPASGLQLDLEQSGGQVNLPAGAPASARALALDVVRVVCQGNALVAYDPQAEQLMTERHDASW